MNEITGIIVIAFLVLLYAYLSARSAKAKKYGNIDRAFLTRSGLRISGNMYVNDSGIHGDWDDPKAGAPTTDEGAESEEELL